ncbi:MAG: MerR family transcriptional regulator [Actinomycetota bacterium]|nr:MerR family transcriptional regulator [Actinomycetota bacterium]
MATDAGLSLTTAQLAERTGMPAGTLRMWETRYGFPSPVRRPGGHHRYSLRDVDVVREVLRLREQGLSITAAIARARTDESRRPTSIFAGLRESRPDLQPVSLSKRALLSLTHALEDEYCARAGAGLLIASFQRARFFQQSERRWRELARTAELACVLADFEMARQPPDGPVEVPVAPDHALAREWTLVIDAPGARACLAGWEQPTATDLPDLQRRFEVIWSFEPEVVQVAAAIAIEIVRELAPAVAGRLPSPQEGPVSSSSPELRFATGLAHRIVGYLAG